MTLSPKLKQMLNKVPEVTLYFWIIKIACTTIGETAADFLQMKLNFGLTNTTYLMSALLLVILFFQFKTKKYVPLVYWLAVVFLSVVGTLITDNLTDNLGVSLYTTTTVFSVTLIATFGIWYWAEKTLSIHSIVTRKREIFYWLAILFTFALGTASGDLIAEQFRIGYLNSAFLFGGLIAIITAAHYIIRAKLAKEHKHQSTNAVLAFWLAYILTRPLGASIGDYLSQDHKYGGLALGTTIISMFFFGIIVILVVYLTLTKRDQKTPVLIEN